MTIHNSGIIIDDDTGVQLSHTSFVPKRKKQKDHYTPPGYIPIELSTKGALNIPPIIFIRNFSTEHLLELSMLEEFAIPEKLVEILNSLIYHFPEEDPIDVALWPEEIVIELIIKLYVNYFSPVLPNLPLLLTEEEKEELKAAGKPLPINPTIDLNLTSLKTYDITPSKIKPYLLIKRKSSNSSLPPFEAKFLTYPRMKEGILLQKYLKEKFLEKDNYFKSIEKKLMSPDVSDSVTEEEKTAFNIYMIEKLKTTFIIGRILLLVELNGRNIEHLSLEERIKLYYENFDLQDVRLTKKLNEQYEKIKIGIIPEVEILHPYTQKLCVRRFNFRLMEILQAIQSTNSDEYDIFYDDTN